MNLLNFHVYVLTKINVVVILCRDYIMDLLEGGRKLIVFAHHKVVLDAICEATDNKVHAELMAAYILRVYAYTLVSVLISLLPRPSLPFRVLVMQYI